MKKTIMAAIVVSGSLIGGALSAQQTAPNNKNMPNANPATEVPREINPSNPGQVAPKGPGLDQKIPGQEGTIPEIIQRPGERDSASADSPTASSASANDRFPRRNSPGARSSQDKRLRSGSGQWQFARGHSRSLA